MSAPLFLQPVNSPIQLSGLGAPTQNVSFDEPMVITARPPTPNDVQAEREALAMYAAANPLQGAFINVGPLLGAAAALGGVLLAVFADKKRGLAAGVGAAGLALAVSSVVFRQYVKKGMGLTQTV